MKTILAFLAINAFFLALNALFALLFAGVVILGRWASPAIVETPYLAWPLGLIALGLTLWTCVRIVRFIGRSPRRGRGRARA